MQLLSGFGPKFWGIVVLKSEVPSPGGRIFNFGSARPSLGKLDLGLGFRVFGKLDLGSWCSARVTLSRPPINPEPSQVQIPMKLRLQWYSQDLHDELSECRSRSKVPIMERPGHLG